MSPSLNPFRHQLPATSPVSGSGVLRAAITALSLENGSPGDLRRILCQDYRVAGAIPCGSGTEALVLALRGARALAGPSARVALPAYSCFDVAAAAVEAGCSARFYDLDPASLGPDAASLDAVLGDGVRVAVIAPLFGVPVDWDVLDPILEGHDAIVVEDAAQGHGARWHGGRLGGHGHFGVLSFARGKGWTGGRGGALLVRDAEALSLIPTPTLTPAAARSGLGTVAAAGGHWALGHPGVYGIPRSVPALGLGETRYRPARAPSALPAAAAALLLHSRRAAEDEAAARRGIAEAYERARAPSSLVRGVTAPAGGEPGWIRFPLLIPDGMEGFRDPRRARLLGAAAGYPVLLPDLPAGARLDDRGGGAPGWPGARMLVQRLVTLPTHSRTRPSERAELVSLLPEESDRDA